MSRQPNSGFCHAIPGQRYLGCPLHPCHPPFRALVVAINNYDSSDYKELSGAVADGHTTVKFLKDVLRTPDCDIHILLNNQASRAAILSQLDWLQTAPREKQCSCPFTRLFCFFGHGAEPRRGDQSGDILETTEILCPSDIGVVADGQDPVRGIEAGRIFSLLDEVRPGEGGTIVILDCCKAGRVLRGNRRGSSYVLITASGRNQLAVEDTKAQAGRFTTSFFRVLNKSLDHTFISVMDQIEMSDLHQTPHCEGGGIGSHVFCNQIRVVDDSLIQSRLEKDGTITLSAGFAHGVTLESRFTIHRTNLLDTHLLNPPLSVMVVKSINDFESRLEFSTDDDRVDLPPIFYSRILIRSAVKVTSVYSTKAEWLKEVFSPEVQAELPVSLAKDVTSCDLELRVTGNLVHFFVHNKKAVSVLASAQMKYTAEASDKIGILAVVTAFFNFHYYLGLSSPTSFEEVQMELKKLEKDSTNSLVPVGRNLLDNELANVSIQEEPQHLGVTIYNHGKRSLYPYLFYFDPNDLTIVPWYTPPIGGGAGSLTNSVDAPLPPNSHLPIGYGYDGVTPSSGSSYRLFRRLSQAFRSNVVPLPQGLQGPQGRSFLKSGPFKQLPLNSTREVVEDDMRNVSIAECLQITVVDIDLR